MEPILEIGVRDEEDKVKEMSNKGTEEKKVNLRQRKKEYVRIF